MTQALGAYAATGMGCYEASRAAALSGVPVRTVYYWASQGIVVPSISPVQEKLWSYADLMALRLVAWLRRPKILGADARLPANPMSQVRRALEVLDRRHVSIWSEASAHESPIVLDQRGGIFLFVEGNYVDLKGNRALPHEDRFGLLSPFQIDGFNGPDLRRPRPHLRIVPERVAGEPHVQQTRITTNTLAAMVSRGYDELRVARMYDLSADVVGEAVDLETELGEVA